MSSQIQQVGRFGAQCDNTLTAARTTWEINGERWANAKARLERATTAAQAMAEELLSATSEERESWEQMADSAGRGTQKAASPLQPPFPQQFR